METNQAVEADLSRLEEVLDELERLYRIHRGEKDVRYFGLTYFSEDGNPDNPDNLIPAGIGYDDIVDFHRTLCGLFDDIIEGKQKKNVAWACPRRHGKTAWISNIFLLHAITYRHKRYVVLFSQTTDVAGDFITWGRYQLKLNEKLRGDFGELLHTRPSKNEVDNKYEYVTSSGAKVEAKGLGVQTRGLRHGRNCRPLGKLSEEKARNEAGKLKCRPEPKARETEPGATHRERNNLPTRPRRPTGRKGMLTYRERQPVEETDKKPFR